MSVDRSSTGVCPSCESVIPQSRVLIEYEKRGERAAYAECPSCAEVVGLQ
ncbi:DUF7837 family putative zinc-binding protein [Natronorarus salvus]